MKLVTFSNPAGIERVGALVGSRDHDAVVDLNFAYAALAAEHSEPRPQEKADWLVPSDMRQLFEGSDASLEAAAEALAYVVEGGDNAMAFRGRKLLYRRAEVRLLAPIRPGKLIHTAGNFREHIDELDKAGIEYENKQPAIVFFQNVDAIIGPDEPVVYPVGLTDRLDYELELAVVIKGKHAHLEPAEAEQAIGGYVIFNDITARDIQLDELRNRVFSYCKALETFCPLGPHIVTADEIPDPHALRMVLRVNDEERQVSSTRNMNRRIPEIISLYSGMGYRGGDVLTTGTVSGVAAFSGDPGSWYLQDGDVMECEIEGIGVLRNPVVAEQRKATYRP